MSLTNIGHFSPSSGEISYSIANFTYYFSQNVFSNQILKEFVCFLVRVSEFIAFLGLSRKIMIKLAVTLVNFCFNKYQPTFIS